MFLQRKIESIFLWGAKLPLFLLPFIPLIVTPDLIFPYISGKNFIFRILIEFSLAMYIPLLVSFKRYRPSNTPIFLAILIFTFIVGLADMFGVNSYKSFWSNYERMEGYITIIHLTLFFLLLKSLFKSQRDWKILLNLCILCGVLVCIYAIVNPIPMRITRFTEPYIGRLYGTLGNPPFLASYLLLTGFLSIILVYNTTNFYLRFTYALAIIFNLVVIYLTATRGALLAAVSGALFFTFMWLLFIKDNRNKKIAILLILFAIVFVLVGFLINNGDFINNSRAFQRFKSLSSDPSVKARLDVWKMAWNGFKERPFFGWGQENFIAIYTVNKLPFIPEFREFFDRAHNIFIDWIITTGIIGLISYLAIFCFSIYTLFKKFKKGRIQRIGYITILTAFFVYFIQNLFTFDTISTYLIIYILFAYIDSLNNDEPYNSDEYRNKFKKSYGVFILPALSIILFLLSLFYLNLKPIKQGMLYHHIMRSYPEKYQTYEQLMNDFSLALSYNSLADSYIRRQMIYISTYIIKKGLFDIEDARGFVNKAVSEAEKELNMERENLGKATLIINFYYEISKIIPSFLPRLESLINEYIIMDPEYEWLYFKLADVYLLKKDYRSAFKIIKNAVAQDRLNDKKQMKLALAAILVSREDIVKNSLDTIRRIRLLKDESVALDKETLLTEAEIYLIAQTYIKKEEFLKALQYYKRLIKISPEEASYHFDMAMAYLALDDKEKAMREANRALELDPLNYMDKVNRFINSIKKKS